MSAPLESTERTRQSLIEQIAAITTMQPGTLTEEYRERPDPEGKGVLRLGPYFKYQHWRDGRNFSRRVPADEAGQLREDTANAKQFTRLTTELAQLNIDQTLALRAAETTARDEEKDAKKKLREQACLERFGETQRFIDQAAARLSTEGPGESSEWIEQGLRKALLLDGRKIISSLYNDRDLLPDAPQPLPCETCYRNRTRRILTLFGEINLKRNYYHHRASRTGRHPLDDTLCLEGGYTPAVARLICRAASLSASYQQGAEDLAHYALLELDPRDLGRVVNDVAPGLEQALTSLDPAQTARPAGSIPVLYVSIDGTGTPMRREELKGRRGKQEDGSARTREAKLGCVFTQTSVDEQGRALRDPDSTSYIGTFQGCREAGVLLHQEALRRGLGRAGQVVYLGDGAAWVWENCRLTFPGAEEILDFYHASEHVGDLTKAIHDGDPEAASKLHSEWSEQMKQTSPAALLAETRAMLDEHPEWPHTKRDAIQSEINYLESHSTRTHYGKYRAKGYFIGSGVIEAGCKTVVGRRLKQSGMFWSEKGAQNILSLRCQILGPHLDATWKARRELLAKARIKARRWLPEEKVMAA